MLLIIMLPQAGPEPSGPVYPAAHLQDMKPPFPLDVARSGQDVHVVRPLVPPYLPAGHPVHSASEVSPVVENFPDGQAVQSAEDMLPVDAKYFPASHDMQLPVPLAACKLEKVEHISI